MRRTIHIVANPVSGGGRGRRRAERLALELERRGLRVELRLTTPERDGRAIAAELAAGIDATESAAIAVVGGDGSLNDVLAGLAGRTIPVALLASGTANVWAREIGLPAKPDPVAAVIERGRTIEITLAQAGGEPFLLFAGAGIDARLVERVERDRQRRGGRGGKIGWVLPALHDAVRPLARLRATFDGRSVEGASVLVTRVRSYAAAMRLPAGIEIGDGRLHVLVVPRRSKAWCVWMALRSAFGGGMRAGRDVVHAPTRGPVVIESTAGIEPYHLDGDCRGTTPVEVSLGPHRARLIVP